ncbi:hypothetical protein, partial [Delftia acidovorans]|uniref:hypothetical protein n=1 Tax=Delftia acidovorans TaxID=80866 RepID=UPI00359F24AC
RSSLSKCLSSPGALNETALPGKPESLSAIVIGNLKQFTTTPNLSPMNGERHGAQSAALYQRVH